MTIGDHRKYRDNRRSRCQRRDLFKRWQSCIREISILVFSKVVYRHRSLRDANTFNREDNDLVPSRDVILRCVLNKSIISEDTTDCRGIYGRLLSS